MNRCKVIETSRIATLCLDQITKFRQSRAVIEPRRELLASRHAHLHRKSEDEFAQIFRTSPAQTFDRLDDFEGPGYERVLVSARLTDGSTVSTFVYAIRPASD